jgi:hypothetical protein
LGQLAAKQGRLPEDTRFVAICYLIDQSIGHGDQESDLQVLLEMASNLGYTQEQFDAMLQEVVTSYQSDDGGELIRNAFRK